MNFDMCLLCNFEEHNSKSVQFCVLSSIRIIPISFAEFKIALKVAHTHAHTQAIGEISSKLVSQSRFIFNCY